MLGPFTYNAQMPDQVLRESGFCAFVQLEDEYSISHLVPRKNRCGIYVLRFKDGAYYAGQSVDVVMRFGQHRKAHGDIDGFCWKVTSKTQLDTAERSTITSLEKLGLVLRNVQFTSLPAVGSEIEAILSPDEISKFLKEYNWNDFSGQRAPRAEMVSRTSERFTSLRKKEYFAELRLVLGQYIERCIPSPWKTEVSYWSISCLPQGVKGQVICRLSVGWQEVLTVWEEDGSCAVYFQVGKSLIAKNWRELMSFRRQHCPMYANPYVAGGSDQVRIESFYLEDAVKLLADPRFILGARHLNVSLASKSACMWSRSHCPQIVDALN